MAVNCGAIPQDIPHIAQTILARLGRRAGLQPPHLTDDALEELRSYPFS